MILQALSARYLREIQANFTLCRTACDECYLPCFKSKEHDSEHDCGTDHRCHDQCTFCQDDTGESGTFRCMTLL